MVHLCSRTSGEVTARCSIPAFRFEGGCCRRGLDARCRTGSDTVVGGGYGVSLMQRGRAWSQRSTDHGGMRLARWEQSASASFHSGEAGRHRGDGVCAASPSRYSSRCRFRIPGAENVRLRRSRILDGGGELVVLAEANKFFALARIELEQLHQGSLVPRIERIVGPSRRRSCRGLCCKVWPAW